MKKTLTLTAVLVLCGLAASQLVTRFRQERADTNYVVYADWAEVRLAALRLQLSDVELLQKLKSSGVGGVLVGVSTVDDYMAEGMSFRTREQSLLIQEQLKNRGMTGTRVAPDGARVRLVTSRVSWDRLRDMEVGFNPEVFNAAQAENLRVMLRVEQDAWINADYVFQELDAIVPRLPGVSILFSSDLLPGGMDSVPAWSAWVQSHNVRLPFFEFKPAKGARMMVARNPPLARRAHTIPSNELKDMLPNVAQARWLRAVRDRACRYLLVHMAPEDSLDSYLQKTQALQDALIQDGFTPELPAIEASWAHLPRANTLRSLLCLLMAILIPAAALALSKPYSPWQRFGIILVLTVTGASLMAAFADTPLTRLQVIPFRGIKAAVMLGWTGCFLVLFRSYEVRAFLAQSLRRVDLVLLGVCGAVLLYLMLRTGNAGANWKVGWEQGLRQHLEQWMVARPRFKEFAIGYPLLILGLHHGRSTGARLLTAIGMIGPVSVVNTFCHLHSPLYLAYWRTANGVLLGMILGWMMVRLGKWLPSR